MANTRLFDSWQIGLDLPAPFDRAASGQGRYSTKEEDCSCHNRATRGKKATLFPGVLRAMLNLMWEGEVEGNIAAGAQLAAGRQAAFYCMEYKKAYQEKEMDCVIVYNPKNGRFKEGIIATPELETAFSLELKDQRIAAPLPVLAGQNTGEELLALLVYASIEEEGPLFAAEFHYHYQKLKAMYDNNNWKDADGMMNAAYICCDNLFCRIENGPQLGSDGIPFDRDRYRQGNVDSLSHQEIISGVYSPNKTALGQFMVFQVTDRKEEYDIAEMQKVYGRKLKLSGSKQKLVPSLPDSYKVGKEAAEILETAKTTPERIFMLTGSAGVGKSTDAKIIAQVLGYPYYFFTCGPDTDELSLVASMMPNTRQGEEKTVNFPTYEDMLMAPASALKEISGKYQEGIGQEEAFSAILESAYRQGYQAAKREKDYMMVESQIIEGCKGSSVIEIQEPSVIERSAALVKLNSLLDDTAAITLLNGKVIYRHPETIFILTTNLNYMGCRNFNESVLSRVQSVQHREDMTVEQMVRRAHRRTGFKDLTLLKKMAEIALEIRKHIQEEGIRGGLCEYREYENWVWSFIAKRNIMDAVKDTVIGKASMDQEERQEMMDIYVRPHFQEAA